MKAYFQKLVAHHQVLILNQPIASPLINYGLGFYGDSDYVLYTDYETMSQTGVGTVAFNVRLDTVDDYRIYNDVVNTIDTGILCRTYADGRLNAGMYRNVESTVTFNATTAAGVIQAGVSHSVVIVYDYPTGMRIYVDSIEVATSTPANTPYATSPADLELVWGYNYNDYQTLELDGVLGNIAIADNVVWSVGDIGDYYNGIVPSCMTYGVDTYIPCSDGRGNRLLQNVMNFSKSGRLNLISNPTYQQREEVVDFPSYASIYGYNDLDGYVAAGDIYESANIAANLEEIEFEIYIDGDYPAGITYGVLFASFDANDATARFLAYGNFTSNLNTETFAAVTDGITYIETPIETGLRRFKLIWNISTSIYDIYLDGVLQPTIEYTAGTMLTARQFILGARSIGATPRPTAFTYLRLNSDVLINGKWVNSSMVNATDGTTCYFLAKADGSGYDVNGNAVLN